MELFLRAGDLYTMDNKVQKHFKHGVPPAAFVGNINRDSDTFGRRMVAVFCDGDYRVFKKDSGVLVESVMKQNVVFKFGRPEALEEGQVKSRVELYENGWHGSMQRGVHGNRYSGAKSLVLSYKNNNNKIKGNLLYYQASSSNGAMALTATQSSSKRYKDGVRVFEKLQDVQQYKYCGIFRVVSTTLDVRKVNFMLQKVQKRQQHTDDEKKEFVWRLRSEFGGNISAAAESMQLARMQLSRYNQQY